MKKCLGAILDVLEYLFNDFHVRINGNAVHTIQGLGKKPLSAYLDKWIFFHDK